MIDAHPALKARLAAGADRPTGSSATTATTTARCSCRTCSTSSPASAGRGPSRPRSGRRPPFDHGTPDGYELLPRVGPLANADAKYFKGEVAFWNEVMKHGTYDDFWKARNLRPHLKNIKPAVMTVGGWFDAENLFGALETYKRSRRAEPGRGEHAGHGPVGPRRLGAQRRRQARRRALRRQDRRATTASTSSCRSSSTTSRARATRRRPKAWVFETGHQPLARSTTPGRRRTRSRRRSTSTRTASCRFEAADGRADAAFDEYVSDPAKPVPFIDKTCIGMTREYMIADQRFAARRPDVLVYQTERAGGGPDLAGPIAAELHVSTTGTDADWVVKLIDVYPDDYPDPRPEPRPSVQMGGYQQLVRGDVMRGKFRNSFEKPEPFEPGKPTQGEVHAARRLPHVPPRPPHHGAGAEQLVPAGGPQPADVRGHLRQAKAEDFKKATQRVYRTPRLPSRVRAGAAVDRPATARLGGGAETDRLAAGRRSRLPGVVMVLAIGALAASGAWKPRHLAPVRTGASSARCRQHGDRARRDRGAGEVLLRVPAERRSSGAGASPSTAGAR